MQQLQHHLMLLQQLSGCALLLLLCLHLLAVCSKGLALVVCSSMQVSCMHGRP